MKSVIPSLAVADIEASVKFYTDVLGFNATFILPGEDGKPVHASMMRGDAMLMFGRLDAASEHDRGRLGLGVVIYSTVADDEDIDAAFAHARNAGAKVMQEPVDQFWGHRDWGIADPDGYLFWVSKDMKALSGAEITEAMANAAD